MNKETFFLGFTAARQYWYGVLTQALKSSKHCVRVHLSAVSIWILGSHGVGNTRDAKSSGCELWLQGAMNNKDPLAGLFWIVASLEFCVFFLMGNRKLCHLQRIGLAQRPAKEVLILDLHFRPCPKGCLCVSCKHEM